MVVDGPPHGQLELNLVVIPDDRFLAEIRLGLTVRFWPSCL